MMNLPNKRTLDYRVMSDPIFTCGPVTCFDHGNTYTMRMVADVLFIVAKSRIC